MAKTEVWQRGPIEGVPALLQPVAHTLLQCVEELEATLTGLSPEEVWLAADATSASIGFHVRHAIGALDRLFTYARDEALSDEQRRAAAQESQPDPALTGDALLARFRAAVDRALAQVRATDASTLTNARFVGRARLPSTVLGLLFHAAEHTQRHAGQALTTRKLLIGRRALATTDMYGLIGKMKTIPGKRDALIAILLEGTSGMPGCLSYIIATDPADGDAIWVTEVWETSDAHRASLSLPAVQQAIADGRPLIAAFGERFETAPVGGAGLRFPGRS